VRSRIFVTAVIAIFLAACNSQAQEPTVVPQVPSQAPVEQTQPTLDAGPLVPTQPELPPTPRPDMAATNPSTVVLAAGEPTLVEFFAFW
jgi:hypothetical protein